MKSIKYLRFANKLSLLVLFTLVFSCLAGAQTVKRGDSILKDGIAIIPSEGGYLIGFRDYNANKIGFVFSRSDLPVFQEAIYDDFYNENFWKTERMIVKKDGKWGALGTELGSLGNVMVPFLYDTMTPFKDGRARVSLSGESFYIDVDGNRL